MQRTSSCDTCISATFYISCPIAFSCSDPSLSNGDHRDPSVLTSLHERPLEIIQADTTERRLSSCLERHLHRKPASAGHPCTALRGICEISRTGRDFIQRHTSTRRRPQAPRRSTAGVPKQTRESEIRGVQLCICSFTARTAQDAAERCQ